jgi:hypothetical protein
MRETAGQNATSPPPRAQTTQSQSSGDASLTPSSVSITEKDAEKCLPESLAEGTDVGKDPDLVRERKEMRLIISLNIFHPIVAIYVFNLC